MNFCFFDRRTKEHILSLAGSLLWLMYLCLVSFLLWLLAFSSLYCHAELVSASHREPLLVLVRGQILKQVQDDVGGVFAASPMANS